MPVSKKPRNKSKADIQTKYLIGTSLVPKGILRQEQLDKEAKSISNYIDKMSKEKDKIKRRSITRESVPLRVDFIRFTRRPNEDEKPLSLEDASDLHNKNVEESIDKITRDFKKKYEPIYGNKISYEASDIIEIVENYGKTSRRIK